MFAKQYAQYNDVGPAVVIADQQIPVLFVQLLQPLNIPLQPGFRCSRIASPSHQQYIIKLQKADTARHTGGTGSRSLIIPATMIGTEQAMVTRIVKMTLNHNVIAASILDIMNLFR